jgi:hypothetical protein
MVRDWKEGEYVECNNDYMLPDGEVVFRTGVSYKIVRIRNDNGVPWLLVEGVRYTQEFSTFIINGLNHFYNYFISKNQIRKQKLVQLGKYHSI